MDKDFTVLYVGTTVMLIFALVLILFVVWGSTVMAKHRKLAEKRDRYWSERINSIEQLVKKEFKDLLKALNIKL